MASGVYAAETIIEAKNKKDFTSSAFSEYQNKLKKSFIMDDLKNCKNFISFLHSHKHMISEYPALFNELLSDYFCVSEKSKKMIKKEIFGKIKKRVNPLKMAGDMWGAWRNLA